jgi:H+/gluconate symporter-like permease
MSIQVALGLLIWLAYLGWSILLLAPFCAMIAAPMAGEPLFANWTQTFLRARAEMEASGSVEPIAK